MGSIGSMVTEGRRAGLEITVAGNRLRLKGPRSAETVARGLAARKREVLEYLRYEPIAAMSLRSFEDASLAVRVWSKVLGQEVWFVSNHQVTQMSSFDGVCFTAQELRVLLKKGSSPAQLKMVAEAKAVFGGKVVGVKEPEDE